MVKQFVEEIWVGGCRPRFARRRFSRLLNHDLSGLRAIGRLIVDLHVISLHGVALSLALILLDLLVTLSLNVNATVDGNLVVIGTVLSLALNLAVGILNTIHGRVLVDGTIAVSSGGTSVGQFLFFLGEFFGTVLFLFDEVGLRLFGREFGRGRGLGVPIVQTRRG